MKEILMIEATPDVFIPPSSDQEPERRASVADAVYWVWFAVAFLAFAIPVKFC